MKKISKKKIIKMKDIENRLSKREILEYNLMSKSKIKGTLTRFTENKDDKY